MTRLVDTVVMVDTIGRMKRTPYHVVFGETPASERLRVRFSLDDLAACGCLNVHGTLRDRIRLGKV
jgi:hypothetical protein